MYLGFRLLTFDALQDVKFLHSTMHIQILSDFYLHGILWTEVKERNEEANQGICRLVLYLKNVEVYRKI